jgi:hypothetical protein
MLLNYKCCDLFTKFDHDDFFYTNHLESIEASIRSYDAAVNSLGEVVTFNPGERVKIKPVMSFEILNPTGGMSDAVIYRRKVAEEFERDMAASKPGVEDDYILGKVTLPKFNVNRYKATPTSVWLQHPDNTSNQPKVL